MTTSLLPARLNPRTRVSVDRALNVVIAPDSFKGTLAAEAAAAGLAAGWSSVRPHDQIRLLPQADGGEGTARIITAAHADARWIEVASLTGPDSRPLQAGFGLLSDGTAVVDLASASGILHMARLDPLGAHTIGLGELLWQALLAGARRIVLGLGGSASTDGGLGALSALGVRAFDAGGRSLPPGGGALVDLDRISLDALLAPPVQGVELLVDVSSPLLGPRGAAAVFGPQKGATPADITHLEAGLERLATFLGGDPQAPGTGAAGGTGYGLATAWGARFVPGAPGIAELTGLDRACAEADVVVLGEGRLDATSWTGKVIDHALKLSQEVPWRIIVAGDIAAPAPQVVETISLTALAGSSAQAMAEAGRLIIQAGAAAARRVTVLPSSGAQTDTNR